MLLALDSCARQHQAPVVLVQGLEASTVMPLSSPALSIHDHELFTAPPATPRATPGEVESPLRSAVRLNYRDAHDTFSSQWFQTFFREK